MKNPGGTDLQQPPNNAAISREVQSKFQSSRRELRAHTERVGEVWAVLCYLNSVEAVQASGTSLKTPFSDLTNPFDSPHIIRDGRKFSKTPAIKYFSFPAM